jgi:hypothetical protein
MKFRISGYRPNPAFVAVVMGACLLLGCASKETKQESVLREGNKFFEAYLTGDASSARRSLQEALQFFQSPAADVLEPSGHAGILYFTYARLYALESRTGDKAAAEAAVAKARSWNEKRYDLAGTTDGASREECRLFSTPEKIMEVADKLDRAATSAL